MIGEKIKFIRTEKGITGKELAEKAEVTPGYISQIERNLISPSLSVLMRIAEVLEIPLVSLFTEEEEEQVTVIRKDKRTKIQFADINMEYQFATPYSRNKNICTQMEMICLRTKLSEQKFSTLVLLGRKALGLYDCAISRRSGRMYPGAEGNIGISYRGYRLYPE